MVTIIQKKPKRTGTPAGKPKAALNPRSKMAAQGKVKLKSVKAAVKKSKPTKRAAPSAKPVEGSDKKKAQEVNLQPVKETIEKQKSTTVAVAFLTAAARTAAPKPALSDTKRGLVERHKPMKRSTRINQFAFMKAPGREHEFEVGNAVEVFCDHEKSSERIRGWIRGIVVQVDNKMVAVQFRSNVYLTDGWMVPDRILWFPLTSEHIRAVAGKTSAVKKEFIPDY